jgi:hypothetical protein
MSSPPAIPSSLPALKLRSARVRSRPARTDPQPMRPVVKREQKSLLAKCGPLAFVAWEHAHCWTVISRGFGKRFLAMSRVLWILALSGLCLLPDRASADALKPHESVASEISSRQRCACTWRRPTRVVHYKRYRSVRAAYPIGFDPLPYRFGYFPEPYRYHRVAMLTVRPAGYRYYRWR